MEKIESRSEPRVAYRAPIWIRPNEGEPACAGETRNLSRRGLFVEVTPTPRLGSEVLCEIPGRAALRGRVAWILPGGTEEARDASVPPTGVGIELVDLADDLADDLVADDSPRLDDDGTQALELRVAGLPTPIRAMGQITREGVELSTSLAFLREGGEVSVGATKSAADAHLHGRIARVGLEIEDGVPKLRISIAVEAKRPPLALDASDERWFPEVVVVPEAQAPLTSLEPETTVRTVTDAFAEAEIDARSEASAARISMMPEVMEPMPGRPTSTRRGLVVALGLVVAGALLLVIALPTPSAPVVEPEAAPVAEAKVEITTVPTQPDPVVAQPAAAAHAQVAAPVIVEKTTEPTTDKPLAPVPVLSPEHPVDEPATATAAAPTAAAAPDTAAPPTGAWRPQIVSIGAAPTVMIPLTGARGLSTFSMSDPPGLAVDLPHGKTEVVMKSYLFHDAAFRSLWVRARPAGGLQIRLHVNTGVHVIAEPVDGGLRFRRVSK